MKERSEAAKAEFDIVYLFQFSGLRDKVSKGFREHHEINMVFSNPKWEKKDPFSSFFPFPEAIYPRISKIAV